MAANNPDDFELFQSVRQNQPQITSLSFCNRDQLTSLDPLKYFPNLRSLRMEGCCNVRHLMPIIGTLTGLRVLYVNSILHSVKDLSPLKSLKYLTYLSLPGSATEKIDVIEHLPQLQTLNLSGGSLIKDFNSISALKNLRQLKLNNVFGFTDGYQDLTFLKHNGSLEYLDIGSSDAIRDLSPVFSLDRLTTLILNNMEYFLASSEGIQNLKRLENLHAGRFVLVKDLERIRELKKLRKFYYDKSTMGWEFEDEIRKYLPCVTITENIEDHTW